MSHIGSIMSASEYNCSLVSLTDVTPMSLQRSGRVINGQLSYVLRGVFQTSQGFGTCKNTCKLGGRPRGEILSSEKGTTFCALEST